MKSSMYNISMTTRLHYTFANGHVWNGSIAEADDSVGFNAYHRHRIYKTIEMLDVAEFEVDEVVYADGSILKILENL